MVTKTPLTRLIQAEAYRIVFWQFAGVVLFAFLAFVLGGWVWGISVFAGGLAYALPNLIFVWRVFRYSKPREASQFLAAFMVGEMFKLIFSAGMFLIIVKYLPVSLLSTLVGLVGGMMAFWIVCFWRFSRPKTS